MVPQHRYTLKKNYVRHIQNGTYQKQNYIATILSEVLTLKGTQINIHIYVWTSSGYSIFFRQRQS
jgi:hypothetical protein